MKRVAVDSSSLIAYFSGDKGEDTRLIREAIALSLVYMPPAALTEMLSARRQAPGLLADLKRFPRLPIKPGFWERAGLLRSKVLVQGCKARLGDTLIAQSCIDHDVPLITRDTDFKHFVTHGGLKLALEI